MRWIACVGAIVSLGSCSPDIYFIPGTGQLPDGCDEPPVTNLDGTVWFNQGTVTIKTSGCADTNPEDMLESCVENWAFSQDENEVDIVVDEYQVKGLLCGNQLYLEGGWWLSVADELGECWYEDEDGDEVGIQAEGNVVTVFPAEQRMEGSLVVQGQCTAEYEVVFAPAFVNY
jgi:hypothetical protein